jgi:uncharacterized protein (TIGR03083 family)
MGTTTIDHDTMRLAELAAISETAHALEDADFDRPSLCTGWRVRDVLGHMCVGYLTPMSVMIAKLARRGFDVPKASAIESVAFASARTPQELLAAFDRIHRENVRKGISKVIKPSEGLVDHVIHHRDISRPLGLATTVAPQRLRAALDVMPGLGGFVGAKARVAGLHLVAEDLDWSHGDGPEVRGAGEAILLAASGRALALTELRGDGVPVLRERLTG